MRRLLPVLAVLLLACVPLHVARGDEEPEIAMPADPKAIVISLDRQGGLRPPRKVKDPMLSVQADGTVRAPEVWHGHGTGTMALSAVELRELLRFVVQEQGFLQLDEARIKEEIRSAAGAGGTPPPLDHTNTVIEVRLANRTGTISWYALEETAQRYPQVKALGRLAAVAHRLERLRLVATAGGAEAVARYLDLANAALAKAREGVAPLTTDDLKGAFLLEKGGRRIVFRRTEEGRDRVFASVTDPGEGEPTVSVE